jgi:hypothetical protein
MFVFGNSDHVLFPPIRGGQLGATMGEQSTDASEQCGSQTEDG